MALVAHRQRDAGTRTRQCARSCQSEAGRAAGDDRVAPLERQGNDGAKRGGARAKI